MFLYRFQEGHLRESHHTDSGGLYDVMLHHTSPFDIGDDAIANHRL